MLSPNVFRLCAALWAVAYPFNALAETQSPESCRSETGDNQICLGTEEDCDKLCQSGEPKACQYLGCINFPLFSWSKKSLDYFKQACISPEQLACGSYETMLERALQLDPANTPANVGESLANLLAIDCSKGKTDSCSSLGTRYQYGTFGLSRDSSKAIKFLRPACALDAENCKGIGDLISETQKTKEGRSLSVHFYEKCCFAKSGAWKSHCCGRAADILLSSSNFDPNTAKLLLKISCLNMGAGVEEMRSCVTLCKKSWSPEPYQDFLMAINSKNGEEWMKNKDPERIMSSTRVLQALEKCQEHMHKPNEENKLACRLLFCMKKSKQLDTHKWPDLLRILCINGNEESCAEMEATNSSSACKK